MAETNNRIENENEPLVWNGWVGDADDVRRISNVNFRQRVMSLATRDDTFNTTAYLSRAYEELETIAEAEKISPDVIAPWMASIANRHEYLQDLEAQRRVDEQIDALARYNEMREPSFELALMEFQRAERLCEFYKVEDYKLMLNKLKNPEERRIFEVEFKIYNAALTKRFGHDTMKEVGTNNELKMISAADVIDLFKNLPGYLEAMQLIARIVVKREKIGNLDYSLLDVRDQDKFIEATNELDRLVAVNLAGENGDSSQIDHYLFMARRAINTAINTMYSFNVFESYNTFWKGNVRYKCLEGSGVAQAGEEGPTMYTRLSCPAIQQALCPMDDLIADAIKDATKKPNEIRSATTDWANTQMRKAGITSPRDYDYVLVIGVSDADTRRYWTIEKNRSDGKNILLVPPCRETKMFGSVLETNKVNLENGTKKKIIDALADGDEINFDNNGLSNEMCKLYATDAPTLDDLKNAFRGGKVEYITDIFKFLGSIGLGAKRDVIAWFYVEYTKLLSPKKRIPELDRPGLNSTRYERKQLGLFNQNLLNSFRGYSKFNNFDFIKYLQGL